MNYRMTVLGLAAFGIVGASALRSFASTPVVPSHKAVFLANPDMGDKDKADKDKGDKDKEDDEKDQVKVDLDKLPAAVVATVKKELPDGTITEAVIKEKKGKKYYEVDVKSGGIAYEIKTAEDGTFKSKKVDEDEDEKK
jgi:uncharacterized membrane protein YkoI